MKKSLAIIFILSLLVTGCGTLKPSSRPAWPSVPSALLVPAPDLIPLKPSQTELSDLLENANLNYSEYFVLRNKYDAWIDWYNTQKQIYDNSK